MPVYFVQAGEDGPIKIGFATNVAQRMSALQVTSPVRLRPLAYLEGGKETERELHHCFRDHRIVGEWFAATADLLALVAASVPFVPRERRVASDVINALGGNRKVAVMFGVKSSAVSNWRALNRFPARLHYRLSKECEAQGIDLDARLLTEPASIAQTTEAA